MQSTAGKTRLLSIRLADDEYDKLKEACIAAGIRSLSEYSRLAIMHRASVKAMEPGSLGEDLATLTERLNDLDAAMKDISRQISHLLGRRAYGATR